MTKCCSFFFILIDLSNFVCERLNCKADGGIAIQCKTDKFLERNTDTAGGTLLLLIHSVVITETCRRNGQGNGVWVILR